MRYKKLAVFMTVICGVFFITIQHFSVHDLIFTSLQQNKSRSDFHLWFFENPSNTPAESPPKCWESEEYLPNITRQPQNHSVPLLTLFTTMRNSSSKQHIYENTIRNWGLLRKYGINPIFYHVPGEIDFRDLCKEHGWETFSVPKLSKAKVPVLRHMFLDAQKRFPDSVFYGYANGDILFDTGLVDTLKTLKKFCSKLDSVLLVGMRSNAIVDSLPIQTIEAVSKLKRKLFLPNAQDYFLTTYNGYPWMKIPNFVVGRVGYDNWLVANAIRKNIKVIDLTKTTLALHQTGKDGNFAGHKLQITNDTYINYALAGNKYNYQLGNVYCSHFKSTYRLKDIKICERQINKCEKIFEKFHLNPHRFASI